MPVLSPPVQIPQRVLDRHHKYVGPVDSNGCKPWLASLGSHGYGQIGWVDGGVRSATTAHRAAWTDRYGPIPPGMTVDHICRNRPCVNTDHLRLLTNVENASDNGNARKTHCPQGHEYSESNTRRDVHGFRYCRLCGDAANAARTI